MEKRQSQSESYDVMAKLAIIGDSSVGKTNILLRYMHGEASMSHVATIGIDFKVKSVNVDGFKIKLQIWDTAGQQRFRNLTGTVYQGTEAILLVYSITDKKSFKSLDRWIQDVKQNAPPKVIIGLVGNKTDLQQERVVSQQQGKAVAAKIQNCVFLETSAKENTNINQIFMEVCRRIKSKCGSVKSKGRNSVKANSKVKEPERRESKVKLSKEETKAPKKKECC